jgi:thymidylate kinase
MKARSKIIIYEGAQGAGKTSASRLTRELRPYTTLISQSGIKDKSLSGERKIMATHGGILNMIDVTKDSDISYVMDRCFLTEQVYSSLGYTEYDFEQCFNILCSRLNHISEDFDVYLYVLTADEDTFEQRLHRDKPQHSNVVFGKNTSIAQQETYMTWAKLLKGKCPNVDVSFVDTVGKSTMDIVLDILHCIDDPKI